MQHLKSLFLILLLFIFDFPVIHGQENSKIDSLLSIMPQERDTPRIRILTDLFIESIYTDHEQAFGYISEQVDIANELGLTREMAQANNMLGVYYNITSDYNKSLKQFLLAEKQYKEIDDKRYLSLVYNNMSISNRNLGNLTEALDNQMSSLKLKESQNLEPEDVAPSYWNIGNIHGDIENYHESNEWYKKALKIYEDLAYESDIISLEYNIALNYNHMDSLDKALPYFEKYIEYNRENGYLNDLAGGLDNMGSIYMNKGQFKKAEKYYLEALGYAENNGEKSLPGLLYRRLAKLYSKMGRQNLALKYAFDALSVSEETGVKKKKINDYLVISDIYKEKGQWSNAYEYYVKFHELNDSILSQENIDRMNEMEIKYQTEKKEQDLLIEKNKVELLEQKAKISKTQKWLLLSSLIASMFIAFLIILNIKQKLKRNKLEKEKLDFELDLKKQELLAFTTQLVQKNEMLEDLKYNIESLKSSNGSDQSNAYSKLIKSIDISLNDDASWKSFMKRFEKVHPEFSKHISSKFPELTNNDIRLISLIKMNLSSKEIARLLNISLEGIKKARYRIRKKLQMDSQQSLDQFILKF